jgi:tetraacyldisaccharide 4'-kinase
MMNSLPPGLSALALPLLVPLAGVHRSVMSLRNLGYDKGWLATHDIGRPVLSLGNLTAGGTGKTPLAALLLEGFLGKGKKLGLVSRGYGASEAGPARVPSDGSRETALRYGDEPAWLAKQFPEVPVVICGDRVGAARHLLSLAPEVDLILADDAFQHRRLARKMDVVVVDATEPEWHYRPLPWGREREGFSSLARAHAIFVTKTNLAPRDRVEPLIERLSRSWPGHGGMIFRFESALAGFAAVGAKSEEGRGHHGSHDRFKGKRMLLVSGIGRPATFEKLMLESAQAEVAGHMVFGDHHRYSATDFEAIEACAAKLGVDTVVVTEKDAVKMSDWRTTLNVCASRLEMRCSAPDLGEFYEAAARLLF